MTYNIGRVSYVNSYPLFLSDFPFDCNIVRNYPAALNEACARGELDASLISLWSYGRIKDTYKILPNFCIAGDGDVKSVILSSKYPIDSLAGKKIFLTPESKSSVSAFRAMCLEKYGFDPYSNRSDSPEGADAVFLIGDAALCFDSSDFNYRYDFGALWKKAMTFPMVYAVVVVKNELFDVLKDGLCEGFCRSLEIFAKDPALYSRNCAAEFAASSGGKLRCLSAEELLDYYNVLVYRLGDADFKKNLLLARKHGAF